jgi:sulfatase maturation enzyme AslB (radical SAM superfamily)
VFSAPSPESSVAAARVRLGLGPERALVGGLVRLGLLQPLVAAAARPAGAVRRAEGPLMTSFAVNTPLPEFSLWNELEGKGIPVSFDLELTARCNNDCRHCYINLPAADRAARAGELTLDEIVAVADQAVELGALWCVLTGGEPLLRPDFSEIYLALKRAGLAGHRVHQRLSAQAGARRSVP